LHHLLDYFRETRVNINDIDLVFEKFLQNKVLIEITDSEGNEINFNEVIEEVFKLLKDNKKELFEDLKGGYLPDL
jgi:tRNA splicing endonuclease